MKLKQEQILVRITGQDRPGLTASIMGILAKYDAQILDIGQADIHSTLSLGILIRMDEMNSGQVMKELLFKATELNVNIGFSPITDDEYEDWVGHQGKNRYILMVLGRQLEARQIEGATRILADQGLNIDSILRLTGRKSIKNPGKHTRACIQFSLRGEPTNRQEMQSKLMRLSQEMEIDFSFQKDDMFRRMRRLICFDMDSTLIQTECIDELAERNGVGAEVRAITESAMRGEIDFKESFTRRVALLKGLDVSVMQDIAEHLPITEGVDRLMSILKTCGYKIAILSGGFTYFGEYLQRRYGIDYVYANELEIGEDDRITVRILRSDGSVFFKRVFTKADFEAQLDDDYRMTGILEGIVFDKTDGNNIIFAGSVSHPQTDEYIPLVVSVSNFGEVSIRRDDQMDTSGSLPAEEPNPDDEGV